MAFRRRFFLNKFTGFTEARLALSTGVALDHYNQRMRRTLRVLDKLEHRMSVISEQWTQMQMDMVQRLEKLQRKTKVQRVQYFMYIMRSTWDFRQVKAAMKSIGDDIMAYMQRVIWFHSVFGDFPEFMRRMNQAESVFELSG